MIELKTTLKLEPETFTDPGEELLGQILTYPQFKNVNNILRAAVEEKLNMSAEEEGYLFKQEFLRGQIAILQYLMAVSEATRHRSMSQETE